MLPLPAPVVAAQAWPGRVLRDGLAWLPVWLLPWLAESSLRAWPPNWPLAATVVGMSLVWMLGVYGNHLGLVPRLFDQGRYLAYLGALLAWVLALHAALRWVEIDWIGYGPAVARLPWYQPGLNILGQLILALPPPPMQRKFKAKPKSQLPKDLNRKGLY